MPDHWGISSRRCPICKKLFFINSYDEWAYARGSIRKDGGGIGKYRKLFCSWHCLREYDRRVEEKKKGRAGEG